MLVIHKIKEIEQLIAFEKQKGLTVGFVPTMGALHQGHISLIEISKKSTNLTVCSIFVNPTQFNNPSDLTLYPRTPETDIKLLEAVGCDILYMPEVSDVYPENDTRAFNFGFLDTVLEGATRPGHFNGVGQVVSILLEGVKPDKAFFGSKDYQQVMVVKELVKQLKLPVEIVSCPILRENDGLAMSSRNTRLSLEERNLASLIPIMMKEAKQIVLQKGVPEAKWFIEQEVIKVPLMKLDYYEICDANTLQSISTIDKDKQAISLIAIFVGKIRLIDNWLIN
jgi:pantoate--beta-alanine ligase